MKVRLLGTHEVGLARDHFSLVVDQKPARLGDSKIRQLHVAFVGDHDILETHVAMHDAQRLAVFVRLGMRISQPAYDTAGDEDTYIHRKDPLFVMQLLTELFEVHAPNQLHGDVIDPFGLTEVIRLDDVGVDEIGHELGFADEIIDELFLVRITLADDFDRQALDEVARPVLLGLIDDAHAAFINLAHDVISQIAVNAEQGTHCFNVRRRCNEVKLGRSSVVYPQFAPLSEGPRKTLARN